MLRPAVLFVTTLLLGFVPFSVAAQNLRVTMLDVGQGESIAIISPSGCAALFDGGPTGSGSVIKSYFRSQGIKKLDFAVATHYHSDHIGGLDEVAQGPDALAVTTVYDHGGVSTSPMYTEYEKRFLGKRRDVNAIRSWSLCGEVQFNLITSNADGINTNNENARSVVIKMSYGSFDMLLGGDLTSDEPNVETRIAHEIGEVEVYKVHHHGSPHGSSMELLSAIKPTVALISVGIKNPYNHPAVSTVQRIHKIGADIWETEDPSSNERLGDITVTSSDGAHYSVSQGQDIKWYTAKTPYTALITDRALEPEGDAEAGIEAGGAGKAETDVTPAPKAPEGLRAAAVSRSEVDLTWETSATERAVSEYRVYRSQGGVFSLAGTSRSSNFSDTSLAEASTYQYFVTAVDGDDHESSDSELVIAITQGVDRDEPTAPYDLRAKSEGGRRVRLKWKAASDNVAVVGYHVRQGSKVIATVNDTMYVDAGLALGRTYKYSVTAFDKAGNESERSNVTAIRTPWPHHDGRRDQ